MNSLTKPYFFLFVILFPFTSWFALNDLLRLPVLLAVLITGLFFIQFFIEKQDPAILVKFSTTELLFILFIVLSVISFFLNYQRANINYIIAFIFILVCYLYVLRRVLIINKIKTEYITRAFYVSTIVLLTILYTEFFLLNIFGFSIRPLFMISEEAYNMISYIRGGLFVSGAGVAEEPGAMAAFLNVVAPIGSYYAIEKKKSYKLVFLYLGALILLFSTAALVTLFVSISLLVLYLRNWKLSLGTFVVIGVVGVFISQTALASSVLNRIMLNPDTMSSFQRLTAWSLAITNFIEAPILGQGPGYATKAFEAGYMSVYLTVLSDIGILSFLVFISIGFLNLRKIFEIPGRLKYYIFVSFCTVSIHYFIMSNFYHAHFWIIIVLIGYLAGNSTKNRKRVILIHEN